MSSMYGAIFLYSVQDNLSLKYLYKLIIGALRWHDIDKIKYSFCVFPDLQVISYKLQFIVRQYII